MNLCNENKWIDNQPIIVYIPKSTIWQSPSKIKLTTNGIDSAKYSSLKKKKSSHI